MNRADSDSNLLDLLSEILVRETMDGLKSRSGVVPLRACLLQTEELGFLDRDAPTLRSVPK